MKFGIQGTYIKESAEQNFLAKIFFIMKTKYKLIN